MPADVQPKLQIFVAGIRRFVFILAGLAAVTLAVTLLFTVLAGWNADRAVSIGFDLVGVFFLVAGFFVGNRGPVRLKGHGAALLFGDRRVRWATQNEREEALSDSAVFIAVGLAMIVVGIAVDNRYTLF